MPPSPVPRPPKFPVSVVTGGQIMFFCAGGGRRMQDRIALHALRFRQNLPGTGGLLVLDTTDLERCVDAQILGGENNSPSGPLVLSATSAWFAGWNE